MDPARFADDLNRLPDTLETLAATLEEGLPGLAAAERLGADIAARTGAAPRVLILGMGSSNYAADIVAREARETGAFVVAELASTCLLPPPSDDLVVLAVSATGGSVEVLNAIAPYTAKGHLVAVTNKVGSKLERLADFTIGQHAGDEVSGIASRSFRHTLLVLREIVAALHPDSHPVRVRMSGLPMLARAARDASEALLASATDWVEPVANALSAPMGTWVLAPMERFSSSRQAALMLREIPRRAAFASETGDWSHVDVYLTKTQDYRALIYAGSEWDAQALEWMTQRGSTWVAVGGELPGAVETVRYPGDDDVRVAQLAEVLVAEHVASHWLTRA